jgi:hypothetical protein
MFAFKANTVGYFPKVWSLLNTVFTDPVAVVLIALVLLPMYLNKPFDAHRIHHT